MVYLVFLDTGDGYNFYGAWENKQDAISFGQQATRDSKFKWALDRYFVVEYEMNTALTDEDSIGINDNEIKV